MSNWRGSPPIRCVDILASRRDIYAWNEKLLLFRAENRIDGRTTNGALTFERRFAVLHGHFLSVLHLSFGFAFDAIVQVCHVFLPPTSLLEKSDVFATRSDRARQIHFVPLTMQLLLHMRCLI
jgi:hypothetical protein